MVVRKRKNWRSSSKARQKRAAEEKHPNTHRVVSLFDATVVLLQSIVEVGVTTMENIAPQRLSDRTGIGAMTICGHSLWRMTHRLECLLEKALRCIHIALLAHHRVNQIPVTINGSREITPFPVDTHVGFIDMPGPPAWPRRFARSCSAISGAKQASQSRTVSWVKTMPRSKNISARSRRLNLYRSRHRTTRSTMSVGYSRKLKGVPVRSLKTRLQLGQQNMR
jgi:hypothetical protein